MRIDSRLYATSLPMASSIFLLFMAIALGFMVLIHPGAACLLSVLFFLYLLIFIKIETGFHLLIFFVPVGSLLVKVEFITKNLPHANKLNIVDNQSVYHIILVGFLFSLLAHILAGHFKVAELDLKFKDSMFFIYALLVTWAAITMSWAPHKLHGAVHLFQLYINIILFFIPVMLIKDKALLKRAMFAWIAIAIAFAFAGIADRIYAQSIELIHRSHTSFSYSWNFPVMDNLEFSFSSKMNTLRAAGLSRFDNASNLINMTIPLLLYFIASSIVTKEKRYLALQLLCLLLLVFMRTLIPNKSGLGSYILSLSFLILGFKPIIKRKYVLLGLSLLVIITIGSFICSNIVFPDATGVLWLKKTISTKDSSSAGTRWQWWTEAIWVMKKKNMFAGLGMGGFKYYVSAPHPHSFLLSFFFDMGVIGISCILSLMAIISYNFYLLIVRQHSDLEKIVFFFAVSLVAFFIHGLVDFEYYMPEFWLFAGTAVAALNLANLDNKAKLVQV